MLVACGKWPPYEAELVEKFKTHRETFETLQSKIEASDYFRVSQTGILGIPRIKDSYDVIAEIEDGESVRREIIQEDREWEELFRRAGLFSVEYYDNAVILGFVGKLTVKNRYVVAEYVHSPEDRAELKSCQEKQRQLGCGLCAVDLDGDWFIRYWWTPDELVPGGFDRVLEGEITEDEYHAIFDEELAKCRLDGYTAIGYDTSGWNGQ